jgi:hypothetical protein
MSSVQKIEYSNSIFTPKNTGYVAAGAILATSFRALSKNTTVTKTHKILGIISVIATVLHVGVIEYLRNKYKKCATSTCGKT